MSFAFVVFIGALVMAGWRKALIIGATAAFYFWLAMETFGIADPIWIFSWTVGCMLFAGFVFGFDVQLYEEEMKKAQARTEARRRAAEEKRATAEASAEIERIKCRSRDSEGS